NSKGKFEEPEHLCLYMTGNLQNKTWKHSAFPIDFYSIKGAVEKLLGLLGLTNISYNENISNQLQSGLSIMAGQHIIGEVGTVSKKVQVRYDIKPVVLYADLSWNAILKMALRNKPTFQAIPKFPAVQRDIAMVGAKELKYSLVENTVKKLNLKKLQSIQLFDVFESEKLGKDKKSIAVNFVFLDEEKTLTDTEIEGWMKKIMQTLEKDLQVEIRK
ncbi:MAG TPA: phenylalanine--tRNA ligase subunit beta, partial [Niabella sp.]|nr:phenylalanine--tRNA ligase subunit beta [Niabella sp.]